MAETLNSQARFFARKTLRVSAAQTLRVFSAADAPTPPEADAACARGKLGIGGEHLPVASIC
eukprot:2177290-Prymnesium_polylepis.1